MYLFIDTTDPENSIVALLNRSGSFADKIEWQGRQNQSEELLQHIEKILIRSEIKKDKIEKIVLIVGPGSYTGLRVGIATGNALAFALDVPVAGIQKDRWERGEIQELIRANDQLPVHAFYLNPPHITKSDGHKS